MMHLERTLLDLIENFLSGSISFSEYAERYYVAYVDATDIDTIREVNRDFFANAQEWLDFTAVEPDAESRRFGWINVAEYRSRLARERESFRLTLG